MQYRNQDTLTRNYQREHEHAIVEHVTRHLERPSFVFHDLVSELVHVDIHVVPPALDRDFWFLFTTGMSARPMRKPSGAPGSRFAEVSLLLPRDWRLDARNDTRWSWPIRELYEAALLPHRFRTWLGYGHAIIPADVAASPAQSRSLDASTRLSWVLVVGGTTLLPENFDVIESGTQRIDLLTLIPMYPEELDHKVAHGLDDLLDAFEAKGINEVIDPVRPSAVAKNASNSRSAVTDRRASAARRAFSVNPIGSTQLRFFSISSTQLRFFSRHEQALDLVASPRRLA